MIRNACIHLNGEQPLLADLFELPLASDAVLRCTNLRTMNGKRPVFADDSAAAFFIPYLNVRFVEIPPGALTDSDLDMPSVIRSEIQLGDGSAAAETEPDFDVELEIDEDFLRRVREA